MLQKTGSSHFYLFFFGPLTIFALLTAGSVGWFIYWTATFFPDFEAYPDTTVSHERRFMEIIPGTCQVSYIHSKSLRYTQHNALLWQRIPESWTTRGRFESTGRDGSYKLITAKRFRTSTGIRIWEGRSDSQVDVRNSLTLTAPKNLCGFIP